MKKLTNLEKQIYASAIVSLFGGTVQATPEQITKEIADDVDSMIKEIAGCSETIRNFAFSLFYNFVLAWLPGKAVEYVFDGVPQNVYTMLGQWWVGNQVDTTVESLLGDWLATLLRNRRFIACVYQARRNWRSKIEIGLLDI